MTPQEKAQDLIKTFHPYTYTAVHNYRQTGEYVDAILCALKAVDEIIESRKDDPRFDDTLYSSTKFYTAHPMHLNYWKQVKQELESL